MFLRTLIVFLGLFIFFNSAKSSAANHAASVTVTEGDFGHGNRPQGAMDDYYNEVMDMFDNSKREKFAPNPYAGMDSMGIVNALIEQDKKGFATEVENTEALRKFRNYLNIRFKDKQLKEKLLNLFVDVNYPVLRIVTALVLNKAGKELNESQKTLLHYIEQDTGSKSKTVAKVIRQIKAASTKIYAHLLTDPLAVTVLLADADIKRHPDYFQKDNEYDQIAKKLLRDDVNLIKDTRPTEFVNFIQDAVAPLLRELGQETGRLLTEYRLYHLLRPSESRGLYGRYANISDDPNAVLKKMGMSTAKTILRKCNLF